MSKRFQLISVADREIMTEYFDTLKEAQARMREEMLDSGLDSLDDIEDKGNGDCGCDDFSAWLNDGNNHMDFDWKIIDLEPARCLK